MGCMQHYDNDLKTLFLAFEDLLHTMQQQEPETIKQYGTKKDYLKTHEYKNAMETYNFYKNKLNIIR